MKKIVFVGSVVLSLVGCASQDPYQNRAEVERERQTSYAERAVSQAPKWMAELPRNTNAVYANGSAVSADMSMAADKAKLVAFGKICMAAGGTVDQRNTMFRSDSTTSSVERSELAIRGMCQRVDISGVEVAEVKTIAEGARFRTYVLVALPIGEANAIQLRQDRLRSEKQALERSQQVFSEMDAPAAKAAQ